MGGIGETVRSSAIVRAQARLQELGAHMSSATQSFSNELPDLAPDALPMAALSEGGVSQAVRMARESPMAWLDDSYCGARASLVSHSINRRIGSPLSGTREAVAAGVMVAFPQAENGLHRSPWKYHAGTVVRADEGLRVIDLLAEDVAIPADEWLRRLNADSNSAFIYSPLQHWDGEVVSAATPSSVAEAVHVLRASIPRWIDRGMTPERPAHLSATYDLSDDWL